MIYEFVINNPSNIDRTTLKRFNIVRKREDLFSIYTLTSSEYVKKIRKITKRFTFEKSKLKPLPVVLPTQQPFSIDGFTFLNKTVPHKSKNIISVVTTKSFGFDHPATILVLEKLKEYNHFYYQKRVLDVGCGSGILSIYLLKSGAKKAYGIDIDPFAIKESRMNLKRSGYNKERAKLLLTDIATLKKTFPFIVANIPINVHSFISENIVSLLDIGGLLVVGGFLFSKKEEILSIYRRLSVVEVDCKEDWGVIVLKK